MPIIGVLCMVPWGNYGGIREIKRAGSQDNSSNALNKLDEVLAKISSNI